MLSPAGPGGAAVEMRGISKRFGDVQALDGVDFSLARHEVHVLAGENGAGKTTLMNVLAGLYAPDAGEIALQGRPVRIGSPRDALRLGIGMVHQHFELVRPFTALENVVLGKEGGGWRLRKAAQRRTAEGLMQRYGLAVDLDARVRDLSIGVQQKIEILKALYRGVDLLILDEPTTHLTPQEVDALFATIRQLVQGGLTVVLITHKLREIRGIGDRITVMRRGRIAGSLARAEATEARLVELLMGGQRLDEPRSPASASLRAPAPELHHAEPGQEGGSSRGQAGPRGGQQTAAAGQPRAALLAPPVLDVQSVSARGTSGRPALDGCSLSVHAGEVLGVAGVAGNGQHELAEVIVGTRPATAGVLRVNGRDLTHAAVRERLLAGVCYVPEDRLREGILPRLSLAETLALGPHHALFQGAWTFDDGRVRALTRDAIADYGIVAPGETAPTARLSGGNIQKLLVARALLLAERAGSGAPVLLAMNPARGLDLGTTALVHRRLIALRERGGAVLLLSEDLDELLRLSDRVAVMYRGRVVGTFDRAAFDAYRIGALMAGSAAPVS